MGKRCGGDAAALTSQVVAGRWFTVFASFLIMSGAGATYLFGIYSKEIKSSLGYDQSTLNLLGFFKDLGANVGVLSGLIAEVIPTWAVLLVGSAMNFAGYFMIWLAVTGRAVNNSIARPAVWQMCLYICLGANSQNFANTGALVTCVKNFPESRGIMLGLLKGFVGLSGAVMTQMYLAIYGNDSKSLILLIAWLPAAISVVFVYTIRELEPSSRRPGREEVRVFYHFLYVSLVLAVFLMVVTILEKQVVFSKAAYAGSATVVCALLFVPLLIAVREELLIWRNRPVAKLEYESTRPPNPPLADEELSSSVEKPIDSEKLTNENGNGNPVLWNNHLPGDELVVEKAYDPNGKKSSCFCTIWSKPERGEDYTILQALLSVDMGILFLATLCGLGSSLTAVDNLGQIGESLGYKAKTVSSFVSLVSIWNYFGRVFSGFVSETLLAKYKIPRPLMMTAVLLLSCVGHLLIAFPIPGSVYMASVIVGFSFGAQLPLLFAIISELFGLKYYSTLFNCGQLASPLGSYILNVKVTGMLYDKEALKQLAKKGLKRSDVKELTCLGSHCYRLSFVILAAVTFFGALVSFILVVRTREFYRGDIYKKFREQAEVTKSTEDMEKQKALEAIKAGERTN